MDDLGRLSADVRERLRVQMVAVLVPGEQTAVRFLEIPVIPGALYEVAANLPAITDDVDLEDNAVSVLFEVNDE